MDPSNHFQSLLRSIQSKTAFVGVIGLGYVGLPLSNLLHQAGFHVIGYDIDAQKIQKLQTGLSYIRHIQPHITKRLSLSDRFTPTTQFSQLTKCQVLIICLPTPLAPHNEPDMSYVFSAAHQIATILTPATLVVLESTTYPGATDTDLVNILSKSSLSLGHQFFVAFSPEREDPANQTYATSDIPKLVAGVEPKSTALAHMLYKTAGFRDPVLVSSARVAECAKLLENTYRAVNIALVNELKLVFEAMNVNIWDVLDAAATKPFGYHRFDPGPGIGGHCIPVDPFYLTWKAKESTAPCSFIELAAVTNARMPLHVVDRTQHALNQHRKCLNGSQILLLGIAYKSNVDDIREAPSLVIWERLLHLGAHVHYYDPYVPLVCHTRKHAQLTSKRSITDATLKQTIHSYDAVILITHHHDFDNYSFLEGFKGCVIDTRNRIPRDMDLRIVQA